MIGGWVSDLGQSAIASPSGLCVNKYTPAQPSLCHTPAVVPPSQFLFGILVFLNRWLPRIYIVGKRYKNLLLTYVLRSIILYRARSGQRYHTNIFGVSAMHHRVPTIYRLQIRSW